MWDVMSNYKAKARVEEQEKFPVIAPMSKKQAEYLEALNEHQQIIVTGCAGTGKTFLSASRAADNLRVGSISKIVLTRPNVPAGRSLGHFPGTLDEKFSHWVVPFTEVIQTRMNKGAYEVAVKRGDIECVPFEVMRGRTFNDSFIILDEAQNTTPQEMKMFLTRIGRNSQVVINGDISQSDLKEASGLYTVLSMIKKYKMEIPHIEFTVDDIVRSNICAAWIRMFHSEGI